MARLPRFGTAISAAALASMIAGCAAPMSRSSSAAPGKANLAYGLRAQMALGAGDLISAVDLAEKAAEVSPQDATVRTLLGNVYFASGRFASAEAAYADTLSLAADPQIILKLALVQIAQGKKAEALSLLQSARGMIEAADLGLALALAGQPGDAVQLLEQAARASGADSRVRQNLALAYALSGDWSAARMVAAQDLSPALVDSRIDQWMKLSTPARPSDQVAALVGVSPAAADPGQPVRLALTSNSTRVAAAAPQPAPAMEPAAVQPMFAAAEPIQAPAFAAPVVEPIAIAAVEAPASAPTPAPEVQPEPKPAASALLAAAAIAPEAPAAFAAMTSSFAPKVEPASAPKKPAPVRRASAPKPSGDSKAVVQLGAYSSAERVSVAWSQLTQKYPALGNFSPLRARFAGPKGTVWRLSIRGFDNQQDAISRCQLLKSRGGSCFVRSTAGDSPVQVASR